MTHRARLVLAAIAFAAVATANSAGYRYGVSDQAFYIPAVARALNPALFPRDALVFDAQMKRWFGDDVAAAVGPFVPLDDATFAAVWYGATLIVTFAGVTALARRLGADWWTTTAALALVSLRHRIAKTGANSLEGYAQPRTMAFGIGLLALAFLLSRRAWLAWLLVAIAIVVHPTTGLWFGAVAAGAAVWNWRPSAPRFLAVLTTVALAVLIAIRFGMVRGLETMDGAWIAVLADKDYLFPASWPLYAWAVHFACAGGILATHVARVHDRTAVAGERALVAGLMTLVAIFLVSVPLTMSRVALAVQLQVSRVFWVLDVFLAIVLVCWLAGFLERRAGVRARAIMAMLLVSVALARGFYVLRVEATRPLVAWTLPASGWTQALRWLRDQPSDWHVLADPNHVWKYGVGVRLAAFKDTPLDASKDSAMAIYDRELARRVADYSRALEWFDTMTETDVRALDAAFDFDVFVDRSNRRFGWPVLFRNNEFVIYDLR